MLTALAVSAYGQGQVILANNAGTLILNALDGQPMPPNSPVTFQLWSGPDASSLTPRLPTTGASAAGSGRIASTIFDIPSAPNGQVAFFQVRAWSSAFATYGDAINAGSWSSLSPVFSSNTSMQNQGDPPPIPVTLAGRFSGLTCLCPDPGTRDLVPNRLGRHGVRCNLAVQNPPSSAFNSRVSLTGRWKRIAIVAK